MHEAINRFESDLRKAVRRGSKSSEFDEQIQEVISHFSDLYLHQLELGKHQDKAEELARSTLGSLPRVAHQILNNSSRRGRGVCIQKSMFWVPAVAALLFIGLQWHSVPLISHLFFTFEKVLGIAFVVCGLRFGYGIHLARKLIWKHLLATCAVTAAI